ncbi:MAG: hypothetical protein ABSE51_20025, partial [Terracidiphilus sp.]
MKHPLFDAYVEACNYPGKLDETAVVAALSDYLAALGIKREIGRIRQGWRLEDYPSLQKSTEAILADFQKRDRHKPLGLAGRAALDAGAALDARDELAARDARAAGDALAA